MDRRCRWPISGCGVGNIVARVRKPDTIRRSLTSSALTLALDLYFTALRNGCRREKGHLNCIAVSSALPPRKPSAKAVPPRFFLASTYVRREEHDAGS